MAVIKHPPLLAARDLEEVAAEAALVTRGATWRAGAQVALELGHGSPRLVEYWGEPQHHRPGPLFAFWRFFRALVRGQRDTDKAMAPLHWLCAQAGGRFVIDDEPEAISGATLNANLTRCIGSFGAYLSKVEAGLADGSIDDGEFDELRRRHREHLAEMHRTDAQLVRLHQERRART